MLQNKRFYCVGGAPVLSVSILVSKFTEIRNILIAINILLAVFILFVIIKKPLFAKRVPKLKFVLLGLLVIFAALLFYFQAAYQGQHTEWFSRGGAGYFITPGGLEYAPNCL